MSLDAARPFYSDRTLENDYNRRAGSPSYWEYGHRARRHQILLLFAFTFENPYKQLCILNKLILLGCFQIQTTEDRIRPVHSTVLTEFARQESPDSNAVVDNV
jgi:hypothetical protein